MKRNTALFGASAAVGITAAAGLIMTSATSSAATSTVYGVAYATDTASHGFAFGNIVDSDGQFVASAKSQNGVSVVAYQSPLLSSATIGVATGCTNGKPAVVVTNGGAAGTYTTKTTVSAAKFIGNPNAVGTVTFLATAGSITVGAYYSPNQPGQYVEIGGVSGCAAATSTTTSTSTSTSTTTTSPTTTGTSTSTSTTTTSPTSTSTSTGTSTPTSTTTSTATQPPTPTATTTTLPVTG